MNNKALCPRLRKSLLHCQIEELVYVRDEEKPSHFKNCNLIVFNILNFPISKVLNPNSMSFKENISPSIGAIKTMPLELGDL